MAQITYRVTLNGTDTNPYERLGVSQNPFPQLADARYHQAEMTLNRLAAEPIPSVAYLREQLTGFHPSFIDECCRRFTPGQMVKFTVGWETPDTREPKEAKS